MKKILFTGILSALFVSASFAQVKFGVTAGLNVSKFNLGGDYSSEEKFDYKAGFQAGVVADLALNENFSIIPELLFSQRGSKRKVTMTEEGISVIIKDDITLNYLQLPINAAYKFDMGLNSKFLVFAGPYLGYGLSAKEKAETTTDGVSISASQDIKFGSKDDELKPIDYGVNLGIGYQFEKILFKLQYNLGLNNLDNEKNYSMKNANFAVSAGYLF